MPKSEYALICEMRLITRQYGSWDFVIMRCVLKLLTCKLCAGEYRNHFATESLKGHVIQHMQIFASSLLQKSMCTCIDLHVLWFFCCGF